MNVILLTGRLGKDPEVRSTNSGQKVCKLSVATDDGYGANKKTNWHIVTAFGEQCGPIETYLKKGSMVGVRGRVDYRSYDKDGVTKYVTEVIADNVEFLSSKGDGEPKDKSHYANPEISDEDIGF